MSETTQIQKPSAHHPSIKPNKAEHESSYHPSDLTATVDSTGPAPDDLLSLAPSGILNPAASSVLSREPSALLQSHTAPRGAGSARPAASPSFGGKNFAGVPNHFAGRPTVQPKLTVGAAHDPYEEEADQVAEQVMRMTAPVSAQSGGADAPDSGGNSIQRAPEEEEIQTKPLAATIRPFVQRTMPQSEDDDVQRTAEDEDELQTKRASAADSFEVGGGFEDRVAATRSGGGSPLPDEVRTFMEPRFGADFSGVRLHAGGEAADLNRSVSAQAFTLGRDIYLGEGQTEVASDGGKRLLAHELTHVVQQGSVGRAQRQAAPAGNHIEHLCPECQTQRKPFEPAEQLRILQRANRIEQLCPECQTQQKQTLKFVQRQVAPAGNRIERLCPECELQRKEEHPAVKQLTRANQIQRLCPACQQPDKQEEKIPPLNESVVALPAAADSNVEGKPDKQSSAKSDAATGEAAAPKTSPEEKEPATRKTADAKADPSAEDRPASDSKQAAGDVSKSTSKPDGSLADLESLGSEKPAPDSTSNILALVEQLRPGGISIEQMAVDQEPSPAEKNRDIVNNPVSPTEQKVDFGPFQQQAVLEKGRLLQTAQQNRQKILETTQAQKALLLQSIDAESQKLEGIYTQAIDRVRGATQKATTEVDASRNAQVAAVNTASAQQLAELAAMSQQKQQEATAAGEAKAVEAEAVGASEAQRAIAGSQAKANDARRVGEAKASQYGGSPGASDIAQTARSMADAAANGMQKAGAEMADKARQDMRGLAGKFRKEAGGVAAAVGDILLKPQSEIKGKQDSTVKELNAVADKASTSLRETGTEAVSRLEGSRQKALDKLRQAGQQALPGFDQFASAACDKVDADTAKAIAQLEGFVTGVMAKWNAAKDSITQEMVSQAQAKLTQSVDEFISQSASFTNIAQQACQFGASSVKQQLDQYAAGIASSVEGSAAAFEAKSTEISGQTVQRIESAAKSSIDNIQQTASGAKTKATEAVTQAQTQWSKDLDTGKAEVAKKIDAGLAKQDAALIELAKGIDEKAKEIERQNLLDKVGSFLGGIAKGIGSAIRGVGHFLGGLVGGFIGSMISAISTIISVAFTAVMNYVVIPLIRAVIAIALSVYDALKSAFTAILNFVLGVIGWIVAVIGFVLINMAEMLLSILVWIASWFGGWKWLEDALKWIREQRAMLGTVIMDLFTPDMYGCDETQKASLAQASAQAVVLANVALGKLSSSPLDAGTQASFNKFFKSTAPQDVATARSVLSRAAAGMQAAPADLKCEPSSSPQCSGALAYTSNMEVVKPFISIHMCSDAINKPVREIALIVIHEATHKYGKTTDHAYYADVFTLNTKQALENADTYEQFVGEVA